MESIDGKPKILTDTVVDNKLNAKENNRRKYDGSSYHNNAYNRHLQSTLFKIYHFLWFLFYTSLVFGYLYIIATYPKLNIFWFTICENYSLSVIVLGVLYFVLSWLLVLCFTIIVVIINHEIPNIITVGISVYGAIILCLLARFINVLPLYQTVFGWFS